MTDANSFGARLDYAVAANLNVYGTFFYAGQGLRRLAVGHFDLASGRKRLRKGDSAWAESDARRRIGGAFKRSAEPRAQLCSEHPGQFFGLGTWRGSGLETAGRSDPANARSLLESRRLVQIRMYRQRRWPILGMTTWRLAVPVAGDGAAIDSGWGINPAKSIDPIWMFQSVMSVDF